MVPRLKKNFEILTSKRPLNKGERDEILAEFAEAEIRKDWQKWQQELSKTGYPIVYRQGKEGDRKIHVKLTNLVKSMKVGQRPQFVYLSDIPYLVRIVSEHTVPAKSLAEVSGKIRKILAPRQVRKTVEQISKDALKKVRVEYK